MGNSETKNKNKETICKVDNAEFNFCVIFILFSLLTQSLRKKMNFFYVRLMHILK